MAWDYAMLTHAAKEAGGPGPMIESIRIAGRAAGRRDMAPLVALALGAGLGIGAISMKAYELWRQNCEAIDAASYEAEAKIMAMGQTSCGADERARDGESEDRGKDD